ncbi:type IV secretory system conjugative DNA transfer family protein [Maribacter algarum]|uniref:Type IV secretory system conjugative DNA transfer family protein n=1 Tax=Maribacter algarum (ex Zhang et al. 2020) TaxID=2578118 RepID=A0A5S3QKR0_9FLAO|nr:type IV secretory system conjugative DNA transfer family protein [Maribacter algarum]TMM58434.1 type IV secretory system conjugative DNA transfer family protein [Maribacter algarum]
METNLISRNELSDGQLTLSIILIFIGIYLIHKKTDIPIFWMLISLCFGLPALIYIIYPFIYFFFRVLRPMLGLRFNLRLLNRNALGFKFLTKSGKIYLDNPFRGIFIQGGAGSGKSNSLFEPIIDQAIKKEYSGILYDFKSPELTKHVFSASNRYPSNVKFYFVDFKDATQSHRINPLNPKYLSNTAYALEFSKSLINNLLPETVLKQDFWGRNAQNILAGLIWFMRNQHPRYCTLPHVISLLLHSNIESLLSEIVKDPVAGGMIASLKQAIDRGAEKQVAGVLSTLQNALSTLNSATIFWVLSGNDLDLNLNDKENPKFLCVGNESSLSETYAPVISLIISVCTKLMNKPDKHHSLILLDEAPTIYIPNFEQIPATGRSNKIATVFGAQDISQINDKYGPQKAQVIVSNLGNQFYGRTTNPMTAKMIKEIFGTHERRYWTKSKSKSKSFRLLGYSASGKNQGQSESVQERERVRASEILNLNAGQFFGILADGEPREFLGVQFKPFRESTIPVDTNLRPVSEDEIYYNYTKIVEETRNLLPSTNQEKSNVTKRKKLRKTLLDLDLD